MANNFYQTNNEIMKLDPYNKSDLEKLQFNQYLCRKENLQRVKNEIDRGLFKLSYTTIMADTGLSRRKSQRFIQWFTDKGIIECIKKSNVKGKESIFAYTSVYYFENKKSDTNNDTNSDTNLYSNSNALDSVSDTNSDTNSDTSKKEKEKENKKTSTSTKSFSISYTEMAIGTAKYKGKTVNIKRFNGEPKRFDGNKYIEQDGYIYEIAKGEMVKVETYLKNNGEIKLTNNFGTNKELEDIKIKDPA